MTQETEEFNISDLKVGNINREIDEIDQTIDFCKKMRKDLQQIGKENLSVNNELTSEKMVSSVLSLEEKIKEQQLKLDQLLEKSVREAKKEIKQLFQQNLDNCKRKNKTDVLFSALGGALVGGFLFKLVASVLVIDSDFV